MTDERPTRIAGVDVGSAVLAATTCLAFTIAVAVLAGSAGLTVVAGASLLSGLGVTRTILPNVE